MPFSLLKRVAEVSKEVARVATFSIRMYLKSEQNIS